MPLNEVIKTSYLIVGNSAGAIGAIEAIREEDKKGRLTVVSEEPYPTYSRPLISKYLSNERTIEDILFRPSDFYVENNIDLLINKKVSRLELAKSRVMLESGEKIVWEKLLLATGGMPIVPKIEGIDRKGVFNFLTIKDAIQIADFIESGQQAVVIGGGLIGISVTEALKKRGIGVTIVEMKDRVMSAILDKEGAVIVGDSIKQQRVKVITNHTVSVIQGNPDVDCVILDSGEKISCDLVVTAIGVAPRIELTTNTDIKVNRGILVDCYMASSYPDVYSCGDVVEMYDFVAESNRVIPIWPNAYMGGRVAGYNMVGISTQYSGFTAMNSLNYFGIDIVTAGAVVAPGSNYEIISRCNNGIYKKIVLNNDYITGMVFIRDIEKSGMIFSLMRDHINVKNFKQELLNDNFGLAHLPPELWKNRLEAV